MSKTQTSNVNQNTLVPNVRIAKGVVQSVRFIVKSNRIVARSKGLPRIVIVQEGNHFVAKSPADVAGVRAYEVNGKTPQKAFAHGVKEFWSTAALALH